MTYPELVGTFRAFVEERAAPYGPVVIGIDELDKMESDQTARKFLNDIKAIFGLHNCFYLVSVSAWIHRSRIGDCRLRASLGW